MKALAKKVVALLLTWEARATLRRFKPKIVAVTGSVGKTSTKDAVFSIFSGRIHTRKSEKSFNSEIGVPLTVLGLPNAWNSLVGWVENIASGFLLLLTKRSYPEWLVLEVGADRPGDIASIAHWLHPDIVVLTRFPDVPVHVEYFGSKEAVIEEKRHLRRALLPTGTLVVNADDPIIRTEQVREGQHLLSYGFTKDAVVRASALRVTYTKHKPTGIAYKVAYQEETLQIALPGVLGVQHVYPMLAAITCGLAEGMSFSAMPELAATHTPAPGRMRILDGMHNTVLIDDTYNASPVAVEAAVTAAGFLKRTGKLFVVLGDMLELGEYSVDEHKRISGIVSEHATDFYAVGIRMRAAGAAAREQGKEGLNVLEFENAEQAVGALLQTVGEGDVVLVKGSQSMRMERVVKALLNDSSQAGELLVRQDSEWRER